MGAGIGALLQAGVNLVLPPRCPSCGLIVETDGRFCEPCWSELEFITAPACAQCGTPLEHDDGEDALCGECLEVEPRFTSARAALVYGGIARKMALSLKHSDKPHLADAMAAHMYRAGLDLLDPETSLLIAVPLHRWRLWSRGYNQALLLARGIAKRSRVPLAVDGLVRLRPTAKSGHLGPAERRANVSKAIGVGPAARARIAGRPIILVDDVLTTGATANACADVLFEAGAEAVHVLAFARVAHGRGESHI